MRACGQPEQSRPSRAKPRLVERPGGAAWHGAGHAAPRAHDAQTPLIRGESGHISILRWGGNRVCRRLGDQLFVQLKPVAHGSLHVVDVRCAHAREGAQRSVCQP